MAKRTVVILVDDVDGSPASETIVYGIDGSAYAIDLNAVNGQELRDALAPYMSVSRHLGRLRTHEAPNRARLGPASASSRPGQQRPADAVEPVPSVHDLGGAPTAPGQSRRVAGQLPGVR